MHPALIASLAALLVALIKLRSISAELTDSNYSRNFWKNSMEEWRNACAAWRGRYDTQVDTINKLQTDNALLRAELKRKHRRVPVL